MRKKNAEGQFDLFAFDAEDEPGAAPVFGVQEFSDQEWDKAVKLSHEREMLGLYVSGHPLRDVEHILAAKADCGIASLTGGEHPDGATVTIGGIISSLQRKVTKQGKVWALTTIEDLEDGLEVMFFPQTYETCSTQLAEDAVVIVKGRLDKREDTPRLIASDLTVPDLSDAALSPPMVIIILVSRVNPPTVERLREVLGTHPGTTEVHLRLQTASRTTVFRLDDRVPARRRVQGPAHSGPHRRPQGPARRLRRGLSGAGRTGVSLLPGIPGNRDTDMQHPTPLRQRVSGGR